MAKHTDGPWRAADKAAWFRGQRHPDDGKIAIQPVGSAGTVANVYGRENARLIAAAPDLLEALKAFGDMVDTVEDAFPNDAVSAGEVCRGSVSFGDFQKARDAIAKATGA